ncbi:hydantoinase/oxoprolinase family protein [Xylophilus sp. ASV27]|uniref:hydantoinase/oxoprolinase family protein n=1 Tax=Xylophilus sp. ASV27 TaxID=2795129 RepID=UPI0018EA6528|nr:hydantoinase/oxoprolinase family protein [Xylophilus sp. ASV27]
MSTTTLPRPADAPYAAAGALTRLINIDNGGTLTDICVIDGDQVHRTKTLTTPHDLSQCLFDGLRKVSALVYGQEDLQALLLSTAAIRYSTTQGTNALVERKGPRLGVIVGGALTVDALRKADGAPDLYDAVIGTRAVHLPAALEGDALEAATIKAVGELAAGGANRLVVSFGGANRREREAQLKRRLLRTFPPHLLGALPVLYASELVDDADDVRRTWTGLLNAFLHPAMERFLYSAEHKLRDAAAQSPLLVFRNDGHAGRVAKTIAVQTYSSGPRGGMEGSCVLAKHYGLPRLLSMDVGGTTTDIGLVDANGVRAERRGRVEGVPTSFALCDVVSAGVGGSSIIRVEDGKVRVGPESVGSAPGPACFGLGGTNATITDAFLLGGLLDPASFFGGALQIDAERARAAIRTHIGEPLKMSDDEAVAAMEAAWVAKVADALRVFTTIDADTTLAAFGGGGPFVACRVADVIGARKVLIPGHAAVFSAYGIGFSDVGHSFTRQVADAQRATLSDAIAQMSTQAERTMFGEGAQPGEYRLEWTLEEALPDGNTRAYALNGAAAPTGLQAGAALTLTLTAIKPMAQARKTGQFGGAVQPAVVNTTREVLLDGKRQALPLVRVEDQPRGVAVSLQGPAVLEEAFFTGRIDAGWTLNINAAGDILLARGTEA